MSKCKLLSNIFVDINILVLEIIRYTYIYIYIYMYMFSLFEKALITAHIGKSRRGKEWKDEALEKTSGGQYS